ncbi:hypothetical protein OU798_03645 [Prolixibacteraceae bacterium Z1-6]|uniref:Two component regulator propeller n=1 Tax=Draconibacterium aestuarii TaxID=2998507 RepID=A0A9X3F2X8_9BACT|nr:hypothetical protein [Prolixibacteraceae bacterium Z1-6]
MNFKDLIFILLIVLATNSARAQIETKTYFQEIKSDIELPDESGENVIKLFHIDGEIVVVSSNGIYTKQNKEWQGKTNGKNWRTACMDENNHIWLAAENEIRSDFGTRIYLPESAKHDTILSLLKTGTTLYVGTTNGLLTYDEKWTDTKIAKGARVSAIQQGKDDEMWLATNDGLYRRANGIWLNLDDNLMASGNKRTYFSLAEQKNGNDIIYGSMYSVGCISGAGNHWIWRGADGFPYGPVTTIHPSGKALWMGTDKGLIKKDSTWHYYLGKRWLPDDKVNDVLVIDDHTVWVATPKGISLLRNVEMTLEQKAAIYEEVVQKRHNRRGLVNASRLSVPGDLSTSKTINQDNDGLWTATYLIAECFRYAVTKEPEAREYAMRTFEALERLETVTGIPGLPARSYALTTDSVLQSKSPHPKVWRPSPDKNWQWLDDTSSDEIVGHMLAISLFYDLVADDDQKIRIRNLVERTMNHIIDNDFHLIDYDGEPTRWGVWHPDSINHSANWIYEKGLYSLEILSFLKAAYYITGNPKFEKTYHYLIDEHGYAANSLQTKMYGPFENSHSDDILTYFSYYSLYRYAKQDKYWSTYKKSLERTWAVSQPDRMPVWNIITSIALNRNCDLHIALEELQQYPVDLINWTMLNSHRWDLQEDRLSDRSNKRQATQPIPTPESGIWRWNTNPRQFDTGANGMEERSGTYFLLPYWMGRYYNLFD